MPSLPDASIWTQFTIIGIIVVVFILIAYGVRKFWKEFTGWLDTQDQKREAEREKQRAFEKEQNSLREEAQNKRDEAWRNAITAIQREQSERTTETNNLLAKLVEQIDGIGKELEEHDAWARQNLQLSDEGDPAYRKRPRNMRTA